MEYFLYGVHRKNGLKIPRYGPTSRCSCPIEKIHQQKDKSAAAFFERFEILVSTAEYQQDDKHVLQKIEQAIHNNLIDSIYNTGTVPEDYEGWKT